MMEYTRDLVIAKASQSFPGEDLEKVLAVLDLYGTQSYERERERVQIAILKLSGGDMQRLREHVKMAKNDYRDVLAYAEFPEEMQHATWKAGNDQAVKNIRSRDRQQYEDWLKKGGKSR